MLSDKEKTVIVRTLAAPLSMGAAQGGSRLE